MRTTGLAPTPGGGGAARSQPVLLTYVLVRQLAAEVADGPRHVEDTEHPQVAGVVGENAVRLPRPPAQLSDLLGVGTPVHRTKPLRVVLGHTEGAQTVTQVEEHEDPLVQDDHPDACARRPPVFPVDRLGAGGADVVADPGGDGLGGEPGHHVPTMAVDDTDQGVLAWPPPGRCVRSDAAGSSRFYAAALHGMFMSHPPPPRSAALPDDMHGARRANVDKDPILVDGVAVDRRREEPPLAGVGANPV
eukprot:gene1285-biopygen12296